MNINWKRIEVFFEFLVFGVVVGVIEDLIAVKIATGEAITWHIVGVVFLVAIPFAILGEIVVDKIDFIELYKKFFKKRG